MQRLRTEDEQILVELERKHLARLTFRTDPTYTGNSSCSPTPRRARRSSFDRMCGPKCARGFRARCLKESAILYYSFPHAVLSHHMPILLHRPNVPLPWHGVSVLGRRAPPGCGAAKKPDRMTLEEAYDRALATDQTIAIALIESHKANLLPLSALTVLGPQISARLGYDPSDTQPSRGCHLQHGQRFDRFPATSHRDSKSQGHHAHRPCARQHHLAADLLDFTVFPAYRLGQTHRRGRASKYQAAVRDTLFGVARASYEVFKQQSIVAVNKETLDLAANEDGEKPDQVGRGRRGPTRSARAAPRGGAQDARSSPRRPWPWPATPRPTYSTSAGTDNFDPGRAPRCEV